MEKIIGKCSRNEGLENSLVWKKRCKEKRKMGHVTFLRNSVEEALEEIEQSNIW